MRSRWVIEPEAPSLYKVSIAWASLYKTEWWCNTIRKSRRRNQFLVTFLIWAYKWCDWSALRDKNSEAASGLRVHHTTAQHFLLLVCCILPRPQLSRYGQKSNKLVLRGLQFCISSILIRKQDDPNNSTYQVTGDVTWRLRYSSFLAMVIILNVVQALLSKGLSNSESKLTGTAAQLGSQFMTSTILPLYKHLCIRVCQTPTPCVHCTVPAAASFIFNTFSAFSAHGGRGIRNPPPSVAYRISPSLVTGWSLSGSTPPRSVSMSFLTWISLTLPKMRVPVFAPLPGWMMSVAWKSYISDQK